MNKHFGRFIISLDFEMLWGVRDKRTIASYGENIKNEHVIIPKILELFTKYEIHATWATVGFLFCRDKLEIEGMCPYKLPTYEDKNLNPYNYIHKIGSGVSVDPHHFCGELISTIINTKNQELATHTFSHYYCLEKGQTILQFESDIESVFLVANKYKIKITSIVFPRNQYNQDNLNVCYKHGIKVYRGNQVHWAYNPHCGRTNTFGKRLFRLIDAYVNLSGHNAYVTPVASPNTIINAQASRFLRPFSSRLRFLELAKLKRITNSMEYAAKTGRVYHLWWHPHNFGKNMQENLDLLEKILTHYKLLSNKYGFLSCNMAELYER